MKFDLAAKLQTGNAPIKPDELNLFAISPNQRRFWILDQLEPGNAAYHIPICLRLIGRLNRESLELGLAAIVARHEPLRSRFVVYNSEPMLVVASRVVVDLQVVDLSAVPESEGEAKAYSLVREEIGKPFDLSRGPPIRALLLILAPAHHILVCTVHHIVCDGWSAELLVREIAEHYEALAAGRDPSIEPLAFPYSTYAVLQHLALDGERLNRQLSYWRRVLAGAPPLLDLRPGGHRPVARRPRGRADRKPRERRQAGGRRQPGRARLSDRPFQPPGGGRRPGTPAGQRPYRERHRRGLQDRRRPDPHLVRAETSRRLPARAAASAGWRCPCRCTR